MAVGSSAFEPRDLQELRLALVMNGGVSLAIWMGGVTKEIDRVRRSAGAYGELADLMAVEPRVDVIAGASAGGINGALLALAMARGTNTDDVRELWIRHGSVEPLLRDPLTRELPSLFRGDEYFLPRVGEAMLRLAGHPEDEGVDHPIHLTITGTTLTAEVKGYADHFGVPIPDSDHRVRFRFRRGQVGDLPPPGDSWPDDFARVGTSGDLPVERLSLAARSTASFPGAFEPSYCPVGPDEVPHLNGRPNMKPVAPGLSASRWLIDGGVLVNTPFRPALDAVATLPADRQVRRVMAYVVPNLGDIEQAPADDQEDMKTPIEVALDSLSRLPRVQSIGRELEEIEANNVRVQRRRRSRRCLLRDLRPGELEQMAAAAYASYVCFRRETAADDIVQLVLDTTHERARDRARREPAPLRDPGALAKLRGSLAAIDPPWLPNRGHQWKDVDVEDWRWGMVPVENAANVTLDVLRRAVRHVLLAESRDAIASLRRRFHDLMTELRVIGQGSTHYWTMNAPAIAETMRAEAPEKELRTLVDGWPYAPRLGAIASGLAGLLVSAAMLVESTEAPPESELFQLLRTLCAADEDDRDRRRQALRRLLALDVVQRASGADLEGVEQEIELVLISADAPNSFDARRLAEEKLAGLQVQHFGSFYKKSWCANDWMWGRLDGADRLTRTLVDPNRMHQLLREARGNSEELTEELIDGIRNVACGGEFGDWLAARWTAEQDEAAVSAEIRALADASAPPPSSTALPRCHEALRRRVQLEILRDEIPAVRDAVKDDLEARTAGDTPGTRWAAGLPPAPLGADQLVTALAECSIAEEKLTDEVGSDYFTKISTKTIAVTASALRHAARGSRLARAVLTPVRGVGVALYLLSRGILEGSRTGRFAVAVALALGGALVALWVIVPAVPGGVPLLGATLLVAAILLAWLRRLRLQAIGVVIVLALIAVGYYAYDRWWGEGRWGDRLAEAAAILLFVVFSAALGMLRHKDKAGSYGAQP